jgi:hypothetical protein
MLALDLERILTGAGHDVVLAADGASAFAKDADLTVRVLAAIVKLNLPDSVTGREVVCRLWAQRPRLPAAVVTSYSPLAPQADLRGMGEPTVPHPARATSPAPITRCCR